MLAHLFHDVLRSFLAAANCAVSNLAGELGLDTKGSKGVEATIAMRRGQWDEAKRLLLEQKDLPLIMGSVIVASIFVLLINAALDVMRVYLDPRAW